MKDKKFNLLIEKLNTVNKGTAKSVIDGADPVLAWMCKKYFHAAFGVQFLLFKIRNPFLYRTLKKDPDSFVLRMFYRYFAFNRTFMIKPENWLMTFTELPSFIQYGDENHLKMKRNRPSKRQSKKIITFCKEYYHYNTIDNLLKVSEIKEGLLRNRAAQIMDMAKLMVCAEDENSPSSGNVPEDFVKQLLK